jgi:macrodomain Ter protein organizer (MatP/YcbG family)
LWTYFLQWKRAGSAIRLTDMLHDACAQMIEFVNSSDAPENLKTILNFLKEDYTDEKLHPLKVEFAPHATQKLEEMAKAKNLTQTEALKQLVEENLDTMEKAEEKFNNLRKSSRRTRKP